MKDPVNGTWSQWSVWESDCSEHRTGDICYQKRKRVCVQGEPVMGVEEKVSCTETGMNVEVETRACLVARDEETKGLTLSDCKIDLKRESRLECQIICYPNFAFSQSYSQVFQI